MATQFHVTFRPFSLPGICSTLVSLALIFPVSALADEGEQQSKPPKLFESDSTLEIHMTAGWRELVANEDFKGTYPAKIEYTDESGNPVSIDLTVERRGVTRQRVCKIPPIKLRFEKGAARGTVFRGQRNLKMVTHCESSSGYAQYYILEMLAYRMYNLLTDHSFRVRPLTVTYFQAGAEDEKESRFSMFKKKTSEGPVFAFLIEQDKDVANRHDLHRLHIPRISPTRLNTDEAAAMALFQYMIANTDWAATMGPDPEDCCHNVKLIGPEPTKPDDVLYALPYDFDSSGLVDAGYAAPAEGLGIRSVTQRLYRGYCAHNASLGAARQKMLTEEQAIYSLVESEARLTDARRKKALKFLGEFFEILRDDKAFRKEIVNSCRG